VPVLREVIIAYYQPHAFKACWVRLKQPGAVPEVSSRGRTAQMESAMKAAIRAATANTMSASSDRWRNL
jgi:hypothetical protein